MARERYLLATCERVEIYLAGSACNDRDCVARWAAALEVPAGAFAEWSHFVVEGAAAQHLLRVAAGLESRLIGEPQILQQVRLAQQEASGQQSLGPILSTLVRTAIHAGKRVHRDTMLGADRLSAAGLAVERLTAEAGSLRDRVVIVMGTGHLARQVVQRVAAERPGRLVIVSRDSARGRALADCTPCAVNADENWRDMLPQAAGVIACTSGDNYALRVGDLEGRVNSAFCAVDLGVPLNVDPAVARLAGVTLWRLDELPAASASAGEIASAAQIVDDEAARFATWRQGRRAAQSIDEIQRSSPAASRTERRNVHARIMALKSAPATCGAMQPREMVCG
jgi:glutamyl-tRNA reductase